MPDPSDTGPWTQFQTPSEDNGPWTQFQAAIPNQQPWSGAILPWSTDTRGQAHFDPNAGILGKIGSVVQAAASPGDVYRGNLSTPYSGSGSSTASPEVINRAIEFAGSFGPASVALRAGEVIPGEALGQVTTPTAQQLKAAADVGYDAARASPYAVAGSDVADMAQQVQQTLLNNHGVIQETAPKTYAILDKLANPPEGGPGTAVLGTYPGLEAARRALSTLTLEGGTEGFAAQKAIPQLDQFIDAISSDAATARANLAAAKRSNSLTGALDRANTGLQEQAEARADASHSGTNLDNALRQRVASLLQSPDRLAGFSQPEIDALKNVVEGGTIRNAARKVGNFFGGGVGVGSLVAAMGGAGLGHLLGGDKVGAELGFVAPTALGISAKSLENSLARRALGGVDEMVRQRSPLAEALSGLTAPFRGYGGPAMGANNAFVRGVLPPLLAPQNLPEVSPQNFPPSPLAQFIARGGA